MAIFTVRVDPIEFEVPDDELEGLEQPALDALIDEYAGNVLREGISSFVWGCET